MSLKPLRQKFGNDLQDLPKNRVTSMEAIVVFDVTITNNCKTNVLKALSINVFKFQSIRYCTMDDFFGHEFQDQVRFLGNSLVIIVCHGCLIINENNQLTYFNGDYNGALMEKLNDVKDKAKYVWIASCSTVNIDVSTVANYDPDSLEEPKRVHPFVIDGSAGHQPFIPVMTIRWLVAFLLYHQNRAWWECVQHPIRQYSQGNVGMEEKVRTDIWNIADGLEMDDQVLFPSSMSFPEVFLSGVFVAFFPDSSLTILSDVDAIKAYRDFRGKEYKNKKKDISNNFKFENADLANHANDWFNKMSDRSKLNSSCCPNPKQISCFQAGLNHDRMKIFKDSCKTHRLTVDELQCRLLCVESLPNYSRTDSIPAIALVIRKRGRDDDIRACCDSDEFINLIRMVFELAKIKNFRVVVMDSDTNKTSDAISDIVRNNSYYANTHYVDARSHHNSDKRKHFFPTELASNNMVIDQLNFIRRCIVQFNIKAAIGIHGGFLDILNTFGVLPSNTLRCFGLNSGIAEDMINWKSRTDTQYLKFLYPDSATVWVDAFPSQESVNELLARCNCS